MSDKPVTSTDPMKAEVRRGTQQTGAVTERHESTIPRDAPRNHIYVGKRPVMDYAMSALMQLTQGGEVMVKARGLAIGRAVDVAEIVTKRLGNGAFKVKDIRIATDQVKSVETGEIRNVSSIEIVIVK